MTDDPEEREWYSLARKFGVSVEMLQEMMTELEFRRHCEDQQNYPDAADRTAHLLYVNTFLLNLAVGSLINGGNPPFSLRQIAPWSMPEKKNLSSDLEIAAAEAQFGKVGNVKVRVKGNLGA